MNWLLAQSMMHLPAVDSSIHILLDATVKGSVVLVAALLTASALRATSATNRYVIWSFAICSLLAIPLLSVLLPKWQLPLLPSPEALHETLTQTDSPQLANPVRITTVPPVPNRLEIPDLSALFEPAPSGPDSPARTGPGDEELLVEMENMLAPQALQGMNLSPADPIDGSGLKPAEDFEAAPDAETRFGGFHLPDWSWTTWIIGIWSGGATLFIAFLLTGIARIGSITRSALPLDDDRWFGQLRNLAEEAGVQQSVRLLHCRQIRTPMTWGHRNPVILLPTSCLSWSVNRRRVVLLHELVHIRRRDWIMQILSQFICAAYWFNPLVWVAVRRLAIEREQACDDQVLGLGARPTDYASHLLDIARTLTSGGSFTMASLGMAHRSQLEGRLLAILDPKRKRRGFGKFITLTSIIGMGVGIMPLAAVSPWAETALAAPQPGGDDDEIRIQSDDNFNFNWSEDDVSYRLRINGEVVLTEGGIESISDDGVVRIIVKEDGATRKVVITPGHGDLDYAYFVNGDERSMDASDRRWVKRVVKKAVQRFQEFEKEMDNLQVEMDDLKENLGRELAGIEIPDIDLEGLQELERLHLVMPDMEKLHEHLEKLHEMNFEMPELETLHLENLHERLGQLRKLELKELEGLKELRTLRGDDEQVIVVPRGGKYRVITPDDENVHIRIDDGNVIRIPHLEGLESLKELEALKNIHIEMPDMEKLHEHLRELKLHDGGTWWTDHEDDDADGDQRVIVVPRGKGDHRTMVVPSPKDRGHAPDAKHFQKQIREQIQAQIKQLKKQLEHLDQGGQFEFDHDFQFDADDFEFDMEGLNEKIQEAMKRHQHEFKFRGDDGRHEFEMRLAPELKELKEHLKGLKELDEGHMQKLHEHLQGLREMHLPDMEKLHRELAPMLEKMHEKMPDMHKLQERIQNQLKPQMENLQKQMKVLGEYLEEVRAQIEDEVLSIVNEETVSDGLSRSGKADLGKASKELAAQLSDKLGMNIDDGVCAFEQSSRKIAKMISGILQDIEEDYDAKSIERLESAAKAIATRISDLEIKIDSELADKIESFEVEMNTDFDFGDLDFGDDADDDDGDADDDDGWDDGVA